MDNFDAQHRCTMLLDLAGTAEDNGDGRKHRTSGNATNSKCTLPNSRAVYTHTRVPCCSKYSMGVWIQHIASTKDTHTNVERYEPLLTPSKGVISEWSTNEHLSLAQSEVNECAIILSWPGLLPFPLTAISSPRRVALLRHRHQEYCMTLFQGAVCAHG